MSNNNNERNTTTNINYGQRAFEDGYDFSGMSEFERRMSYRHYWSRDSMFDLEAALTVYDYKVNNHASNLFQLTNESWTFETSGCYRGVILDAKRSRKSGSGDYILDILINSNDIKHVKLTHNSDDVVLQGLLDRYDGIMGYIDPVELIGSVVAMKIENVRKASGGIFSKITKFSFWDEEMVDALMNMINLMHMQDDIREAMEAEEEEE